MNYLVRVQVSHGCQHLLDQTTALSFRVVKVWLFVKTVKQVSTRTEVLETTGKRE
jgi:hypothetical protein